MVYSGKKDKKLILVFGAMGLLGSTLCPSLEAIGYRVLRQSRGSGGDILCDPLKQDAVKDIINRYKPSVVVNLIALSNVDRCQDFPGEAFLANVKTVDSICSAIEQSVCQPHLIHISTDHLYNGLGPHLENAVNPSNIYSLTKYTGELLALKVGATVLRTNFFGQSRASGRVGFTDWLFSSIHSGLNFTVFDDVYFSPIHMSTLSICMANVIEAKRQGIFNLGSCSGVSKAHFAQKFADDLGLKTPQMRIGSIMELKLNAPRPKDMRMDIRAFENAFEVTLPDINAEMIIAAKEYREESNAIRK